MSGIDAHNLQYSQSAEPDGEEWPLYCSECRTVVTHSEEAISRGGAHRHTFTNPAGQIYVVGCFARAVGGVPIGEYTRDFSWFKDYAWCYVLCRGCAGHLGWHFSSTGGTDFFGLRLDRLTP